MLLCPYHKTHLKPTDKKAYLIQLDTVVWLLEEWRCDQCGVSVYKSVSDTPLASRVHGNYDEVVQHLLSTGATIIREGSPS